MKVTGLNGREYNLDLKKYDKKRSKCSFYHARVREILAERYKGYSIYEEVKLPGSSSKKSVLYLDFFIPNVRMAVEVHGEQHFKFIPYFHKTKAGYLYAKMRDRDKIQWCELNNINLVVLRYDSSEDHWREQIDSF